MLRALMLMICLLPSAFALDAALQIEAQTQSVTRVSHFLVIKNGKTEFMINMSSIVLIESATWGDMNSFTTIHYSILDKPYQIKILQRHTSYEEIKNMIIKGGK